MKRISLLYLLCVCTVSLFSQQPLPLRDVLRSDGTLETATSEQPVIINPARYVLVSKDVHDPPRFQLQSSETQIAAVNPADAFWDVQFGPNGNESISVEAIVVSNGRVFIGGYFQTFLGMECNSLAYWDGGRWRPVGKGLLNSSNGLGSAAALTAAPNGDIYIGGTFEKAGGVTCNNIAVWNGTTFKALGNGVSNSGSVNAIAVDNNNVYLGGSFTVNGVDGSNNIVRWDGSSWNTMKSGITDGSVSTLLVKGDDLYIGGNFKVVDGKQANNIIIWKKTTQTWETLGQGFSALGSATTAVLTMLFSPQGQLIVGGDFSRSGTKVINNLARWTGTEWEALGGGVLGGGVTALMYDANDLYVAGGFEKTGDNKNLPVLVRWDGSAWHDAGGQTLLASVSALAKLDGKLLAGGSFDYAITEQFIIHGIALWDGTEWASIGGSRGNGTNGFINTLTVDKSGNLIATGSFSTAGGVRSSRIAKFTGGNWDAVEGVPFGESGSLRVVQKGDEMILGGNFDTTGLIRGTGVMRFHPETKNLSLMGTVRGRFGARINALALQANNLYVGGSFSVMEQDTVRGICVHNGTKWNALGTGVAGASASVDAISPDAAGNVYVGGSFTSIGGIPAFSVALWDGSQWNALGAGVSNIGQAANVFCFAIIGNDIYVGGRFDKAGDVPARNIAKWNTQTKQWSAVGQGVNKPVWAFYVKDNFLFIGGDFDSAGVLPAAHIARYDTQNNLWSPLGSGLDGSVNALAYTHGALYAGGGFDLAGNKSSINIARWMRDLTPVEEQPPLDEISEGEVFPNPASALTTLTFTTRVPGQASLSVYNNVGEPVCTLLQGYLDVGTHSYHWNSQGVADGIYYARLQVGRTVLTRKIIIAR